MGTEVQTIDRYLERLAVGLGALGPAEAGEVIAEIEAHIAEVVAEMDGDERAALATFGDPEAFAAQILGERGISEAGPNAPEAPSYMRLAATVVDVVLWLGVLSPPLLWVTMAPVSSDPSLAGVVFTWVIMAFVLGSIVWWWVSPRRAPGHVTVGMRLVGLRRVQVGGARRLVAVRDLPGEVHHGRLRALLLAAGAFLVVWMFVSSYANWQTNQAGATAARGASDAVWLTSDVYREVTTGAEFSRLSGRFSEPAQEDLGRLLSRRDSGEIGSYSIYLFELHDYEGSDDDYYTATVTVAEFPTDSAISNMYDCTVECWKTQVDENDWTRTTLITSITPSGTE
jgi:hypothetical protein